jgi:hypothetical protein
MPTKIPSFVKFLGIMAIFALTPISLYILYHRGGPTSQNEMLLYKNLRFAFMAGTPTVDLGPLTPWPWVRVCAVTDNVTPADVQAVLGFPYAQYDLLHWIKRPEYWTLLFIDNDRESGAGMVTPIEPIRVPRKEVAELKLPGGSKGACVDREHGGLVLTRDPAAPVGTSPVTVSLGPR